MATYYSDHFSGVNPDTGAEDNSVLSKTKYPPDGIGGGRLRYARAEITASPESGDILRMMTFKTGDRIFEMYWTSTDSGSAGLVHVSLHRTGRDHDGTQIEANLMANSISLTSAINHVDKFGTGLPDADLFRGKPLWEIAAIPGSASAGDWTEDPMENWDLGIYGSTAPDVPVQMILEVLYTSEG